MQAAMQLQEQAQANLSDAELDHRVRAAAVESAEQRRADAQAKLQGASDDDYATMSTTCNVNAEPNVESGTNVSPKNVEVVALGTNVSLPPKPKKPGPFSSEEGSTRRAVRRGVSSEAGASRERGSRHAAASRSSTN